MVGAHASFTLSDESLDRLAEAVRDGNSSLHVHVAEDRADVEDSRRRGGSGVVERLRRHGLLGRGTLLVHGVHLVRAGAASTPRPPARGSSTARAPT